MDNIDRLEHFIDSYFNYYNMLTSSASSTTSLHEDTNPAKRKKKDSATDTVDLLTTDAEVSFLQSINKKLDLLEAVHSEIIDIKSSLNFAYDQIEQLQTENKSLQISVATLTKLVDTLTFENGRFGEALLEIQSRSMRDNLIFTGIPENSPLNDPESLIRNFMISKLKLHKETVDSISFQRVHRIGKLANKGPRPIVAKLEHFKHKEIIKSKGK